MEIRNTTTIEAPIEKVWQLTTDVEHWPELMPTVTSVHPLDDGPLVPGSKVRIKQPGQRAKTWHVTTIDAPVQFEWITRGRFISMRATHLLETTSAGTQNSLSIEMTGPLAPVVGRLVGRPVRKVLETENRSFKAAAEG